jgi:hypothetical protein
MLIMTLPASLKALLVAAALSGCVSAHAETFRLPEGLVLEAPDDLEITYQNVPAYDASKKVIVGWDNGKLLYLIDVTRLPQGANDAGRHLERLLMDIGGNSVGRAVNVRSKGQYPAIGGLAGHYVDYRFVPTGSERAQHQVAHFLTDARVSFTVFVSVVDVAATGRALKDSVALLKTAALTLPPQARATAIPEAASRPAATSADMALVGRWTASRKLSDSLTVETLTELKSDHSFSGRGTFNGQTVVEYSGTWSSDGKHIDWNYLHSAPPLQERYRQDQDTIVSFDGQRLVVQSRESGVTRSLARSD